MHSIGAFAAKNTFGTLLDRVGAGEEILITRHGKPAARLTPVTQVSDTDRVRARAALARMSERAKDLKMGPFDWEEWKGYRDEGRR